jgi:hypothetical protein
MDAMKGLMIATMAALWPLAAHSQFDSQEVEWCPDLAPMSSYLSIGFELKAVSERSYAPMDRKDVSSMPNGIRSETVFFLQKGTQLEQCAERIKADTSTVIICSHLVQVFDASKGSPCN